MIDPDFHAPIQKASNDPIDPSVAPPNSALAVVSLVFGIVGWVVLPLIGPLIALITGHLALGEIRDAGGRVGGRPLARAGLMLGYSWFLVGLLALALVLFFFVGWTEVVPPPKPPSSGLDRRVSTGVKMASELTEADLAKIHQKFGPAPATGDEELICFYNLGHAATGVSAMALLTRDRVEYRTGFALKDVEAVLDDDAYRRKYHPNPIVVGGPFMIEVKSRTGSRIGISITPSSDGPAFFHALQDAWKAATGATEHVPLK